MTPVVAQGNNTQLKIKSGSKETQLTAELAVPSTCLSIYLLQVQQDVFINSCINWLSGNIAHDKNLEHNIQRVHLQYSVFL